MKILHIVDDEKFIDGIIRSFDILGVASEYICLVDVASKYRYIQLSNRVTPVVVNSDVYCEYLEDSRFNYIWIHYGDLRKRTFVNNFKGSAKIVWSTWGADYLAFLNSNLLEIETLKVWLRHHSLKSCVGYIIRSVMAHSHLERFFLSDESKKFFSKVDFFSSVLPEEERIVRRLLGKRPIYVPFMYTDLSISYDGSICAEHSSPNIWIGNSASFSSNTIDVVKSVREQHSVQVYVPLSYGSEETKTIFDQVGKELLGNRWHPIMDFVPYDAYVRLMASCGIFVFYHRRQQALGNIRAALLLGGAIVLNKNSPVWVHYKTRGFKIYSLDDLKKGVDYILRDYLNYRGSNVEKIAEIMSFNARKELLIKTIRILEKGTLDYV